MNNTRGGRPQGRGRGRSSNNSSARGRGQGRGGRNGRGRGRGRQPQQNAASLSKPQQPKSSNQKKNKNLHSSTTPPQSSTIVTPPPPLQNGQKGAQSHTVGEADRIRFSKVLVHFREHPSDDKLEFPATLTNTERKFVHELARQLGLTSKSHGKGDERRIVVSKPKTMAVGDNNNADDLPWLQVGPQGVQALRDHVQRCPPSPMEALEAHETGSSLLQALQSSENDTQHLTKALDNLGLMGNHRTDSIPLEFRPPRPVDMDRRQRNYHAALQRQQTSSDYRQHLQQRQRLPVAAHEANIVDTIRTHAVTIISAETGAGKSTQVPQFLLQHEPLCNIVVTQPRRISAMSVAERVAVERCDVGQRVAYQVRQESNVTPHTQLLFCTPGILLRKLQSSPQLAEYTHVVIDEIHEKDRYTEFLLITLRDLLPQRPTLRLVLMSATLQTQALLDYFSLNRQDVALIHIEGRTFPVQEYFLEDVLHMTGYVETNDAESSNRRLERELQKYTAAQQEPLDNGKHSQTKKKPPDVCPACGKADFPNATEFGIHTALCNGPSQEEDDNDEAEESVDWNDQFADADEEDMGDSAWNSEDCENDNNDDNWDQFEDYDVDEKIVLDEETALAMMQDDEDAGDEIIRQDDDDSEEEDPSATPKWDGTSPFEPVVKSSLDALHETMGEDTDEPEDPLLVQYQSMHDDEHVDMDLLLEVLLYICKSSYGDGAILVFLPGWQDISEFLNVLELTPPFRNRSKYRVLPLHSGIPSKDQRRVLAVPPKGVRKIVLSTNLAETSLTVEDVAFVVDCGRAKEKSYDPHLKTSTLQPTWISKASSKQRKGRGGRTKAGVCFHLFSRRRFESMKEHTESELLRTPLEEMCLMCKKLDLAPGGPEDSDGIPAFLSKAMSPPHPKSVSNALSLLVDLGAMLPETNDLTHLGLCLSVLSLEPRVGKMVLWSYVLGCARATSNMAVAMSYKSPFVPPLPNLRRAADKAKVQLSQKSESDQITILHALARKDQLGNNTGALNGFCQQYFLAPNTLTMVASLRKNLANELSYLGFSQPTLMNQYHNRHNKDHSLWQAALAAGLYPNVASRQRGDVNFSTMTNRKAKIHLSSVNALKGQPLSQKSSVPEGVVEFVCFGEMTKGNRIFTMEQTTHLSSPLPLLLLCGTSLNVTPSATDTQSAILNVDDWIVFQCERETAANLVILRKRLESAFLHLVANPSQGLSTMSNVERDAVDVVGPILQSAYRASSSR